MVFLIKYWQPILSAILTALLCWMLASLYITHLEGQHEAELNKMADAMVAQCNQQKTITEERGRELQTKYADIDAKLERLRNLPSTCVTVARPRRCDNAASITGQPAENGISSAWLYDFAGRCDKVVAQLTACQSFVNDIYKANGQ